jgi:hypothetical protein
MLLDLTKSSILMKLLHNMVIGLSGLSKHDMALHQRIGELKQYIHQPHQVNSDAITSTINRGKEIASSYNLGRANHGTTTPNDYITALPGIFFHTSTEVQHLIDSARLSQPMKPRVKHKSFTNPSPNPAPPANVAQQPTNPTIAQLLLNIDRFVKHSSRK